MIYQIRHHDFGVEKMSDRNSGTKIRNFRYGRANYRALNKLMGMRICYNVSKISLKNPICCLLLLKRNFSFNTIGLRLSSAKNILRRRAGVGRFHEEFITIEAKPCATGVGSNTPGTTRIN